MKKILVNVVSAEYGGAKSIIDEFIKSTEKIYDNFEFIFILSKLKYTKTFNATFLNFSWVKKNIFFRIYFEFFTLPFLIKRYNPSFILSFTNFVSFFSKVPHILYFQTPIPLSNYKFSIFNDFKLWFFKNIISVLVLLSLKKCYKIIVQTNCIKSNLIKKLKINPSKIFIIKPNLIEEPNGIFNIKNFRNTFVYPANAYVYKNHMYILKASKLLISRGINNFTIIFTLNRNESNLTKKLFNYTKIHNLPVSFDGFVNRETIMEYYHKFILIFPSSLETFGLPLMEAKSHNTPILSSNLCFSKEILQNYQLSSFFNLDNPKNLATLIEDIIVSKSFKKRIIKSGFESYSLTFDKFIINELKGEL